jgi:TonB-dependent receptor
MLTANRVRRDEPDRTEFVSVIEQDTPGGPEVLRWLNTGNGGAVRTFSELEEKNQEARLNHQLSFPAFGRTHHLKAGVLHRSTDRAADTRAFAINAPLATTAMRELPAEQLFDGRFTDPTDTVFNILPLAQGGAYDARDELSAGYLMADLGLSERLRLVGGARYERDELLVHARSTLEQPVESRNTWTDLLPMAAINFAVTPVQNVRLSVSRTLARPEYRELVPIKSRDVLNGDDLEGNPGLERTGITNADLRWEWYPNSGELLSVGVFVKQFDQPIERVYRAAGANSRFIGFVNAESADNYGVEMEMRKGLGFLGPALDPFSLFSNVTVMRSEIDLGAAQSAATNVKRRMVGQAPYVVNLGLGYLSPAGRLSATMLYNRTGSRIEAAGDIPLPDIIQEPRDMLDLSVRFPVFGAVSGRFDAKNLFDQRFETVQGTVTREAWRTGRVFQLGMAWKP